MSEAFALYANRFESGIPSVAQLPVRLGPASWSGVPVADQVASAEASGFVRGGETGTVAVLRHGLAIFADEPGEMAESDAGFEIDPQRSRIDPLRWSQPWLAGQPGIQRCFVEEKLSAPTTPVAAGR